jgi:hypothetical protein
VAVEWVFRFSLLPASGAERERLKSSASDLLSNLMWMKAHEFLSRASLGESVTVA